MIIKIIEITQLKFFKKCFQTNRVGRKDTWTILKIKQKNKTKNPTNFIQKKTGDIYVIYIPMKLDSKKKIR